MQQLVGRLVAFDPEASESLQVISYFDTLVAGGVGIDALLRGAAVLSGTIAGAELGGKVSRRGVDGARLEASSAVSRSIVRGGESWSVWLEREGAEHASDEMIVERLALAVELLVSRRSPSTGAGLDIVIDEARAQSERAAALSRLRLELGTRVRLVATLVSDTPPGPLSTVVATQYGMLRATLQPSGGAVPTCRAGLGTWGHAEQAPDSWSAAIIALRLTEPATPVVDASDLGSLLMLARAYDPTAPNADVLALDRLDARSARILRVLVEADSIRAAAVELGMHHSSLQSRHESLSRELGYDARTVLGRVRYSAAELLRRLTDPAALASHS